MTPNPNPSPELRKYADLLSRALQYQVELDAANGVVEHHAATNRLHAMWAAKLADGLDTLKGPSVDDIRRAIRSHIKGAPLSHLNAAANAVAALSPQALPAPGEVQDVRKRAQSIWDKRWFCIEGEWSPDEEPIETDEPRHFAEIAIATLTPTFATVAAANDEGVAEAREMANRIIQDLTGREWPAKRDELARLILRNYLPRAIEAEPSASEQVAQWQQEHLAYPGSHWGDAIAWNSAFTIAKKLDESAAIRLLSQEGGE